MEYYGEDTFIGDQIIMDEALEYLESRMNLSEFDADGDTVIDAVVMINTLDIDSINNAIAVGVEFRQIHTAFQIRQRLVHNLLVADCHRRTVIIHGCIFVDGTSALRSKPVF